MPIAIKAKFCNSCYSYQELHTVPIAIKAKFCNSFVQSSTGMPACYV